MIINDEADEVIKNFLNYSKIDIKMIWNQWKVARLSSIMLICCIINVMKYIRIAVNHI